MKKFVVIFVLGFITLSFGAKAQIKVRSDNWVQLSFDNYGPVAIGVSSGTPNNGQWAIEHGDGGLNFWRPWPTSNSGNYFLFLKDDNGYVGVGKIPSYKLDVNGDIATYGTLRISSDKRLKTDIKPMEGCLGKLAKLNGVSYLKSIPDPDKDASESSLAELDKIKRETVKAQMKNTEAAKESMGFIAQDLQAVFPELVKQDKNGYLSVDYISIIPVLVEAMKEQQAQIEELKKLIKK